MKNKKKLQKYFNKNYYNKDDNFKVIVSKIIEEENINIKTNMFFNFFKIIATTIISLVATSGLVFASVKIYNEYIKNKGEIQSDDLYRSSDGYYSINFKQNMLYDDSVNLYYKIITNIDDYNKFKHILKDLPVMNAEDFNNDFLIFICDAGARNPHEQDLEISEVTADSEITYLTLKQKEKPNYEKNNITLYAILDKELLRDKVKLEISIPEIKSEKFIAIENLPDTYSIEDALKDGCFVENDSKILSENKYELDELIENSKNSIESFIRIYSKDGNSTRVIDLQYKNNIFMAKGRNLGNSEIIIFSFRFLTKSYYENGMYLFGYNNIDRAIDSTMLLLVSY